MTESAQIQHLTAENNRLKREKHKMHTEFEKCGQHTKALKDQLQAVTSERDQLIEQLTGKAAA